MGRWAYLMITAAAVLWGVISFFVKGLAGYGFTSLQIVAVRVAVSAVALLAYVLITDRAALAIRPADGKYFVGTGVFSVLFFNWCYFSAIRETSVAVAAVLLYTAPAIVTVLSMLLFGEKMTGRKLAALVATIAGCGLVVGLLPDFQGRITILGVALGLGAGLGYALYSVFGKFALRRYGALTVTTYTFVFATVASLPLAGLWEQRQLFLVWPVWGYIIGLGLFSTVLAYLLYTVGLSYVETSRAAITATLEPLVAASVGTVVFGETLSAWQLAGMGLVIAAVAAVQERSSAE